LYLTVENLWSILVADEITLSYILSLYHLKNTRNNV